MPVKAATRISQRDRSNIRQQPKRQPLRGGASASRRPAASATIGLSAIKLSDKPVLDIIAAADTATPQLFADVRRLYLRYCRITKIKPVALSEPVTTNEVRKAFNHFTALIKKENPRATVNIEFDKEEKRYEFVIYSFYKHSRCIWVFPLQFLYELHRRNSKLYPYMLRFSALLISRLGFTSWDDNGHLDYNISMLLEYADELSSEEPETALEIIEEAALYRPDGLATQYLQELDKAHRRIDQTFLRSLRSIRVSGRENYFKKWILRGVPLLMHTDAKHFHNFAWRVDPDAYPEEELYADGDGVQPERLYTIMWNDNSHLGNQYVEGVNMDSGEWGSYDPMEVYFVSDKTRKPYRHSSWFDQVCAWLNDGFRAMFKYIPKPKKKDIDAEEVKAAIKRHQLTENDIDHEEE